LKRQHGASRLELAVAAIFTALLAAVLLNRLIGVQAESEQVAVKQLFGSLRTALAIKSAKVISTTGEGGLIALAQQNPMTWLQRRPENYLGEYYSPNRGTLPGGNWYFDRTAQTLVYLSAAEKSFSSGTQNTMVFKVKLVRVSGPFNASGQAKGTTGLVLDQISDQAVAVHTNAGSVPRPYFSEKK
jgi:general secretion pathway protein G